uniref:Uncharacterized protein n=1 Tax=Streptomyces seoulensis TaxID=73044 RepID=A0A2S1P8M5_STRSO|nr:hypothetical protein [Streptomyces seoulensis]
MSGVLGLGSGDAVASAGIRAARATRLRARGVQSRAGTAGIPRAPLTPRSVETRRRPPAAGPVPRTAATSPSTGRAPAHTCAGRPRPADPTAGASSGRRTHTSGAGTPARSRDGRQVALGSGCRMVGRAAAHRRLRDPLLPARKTGGEPRPGCWMTSTETR